MREGTADYSIIATRSRALRKKTKFINSAPIAQRPSTLNLINTKRFKYGYEFINTNNPVFTNEEIENLKTLYKILSNCGLYNEIDKHLMHHSAKLHEVLSKLSLNKDNKNLDEVIFLTKDLGRSFFYMPSFIQDALGDLNNPGLIIKRKIDVAFPGCIFFTDILKGKERDSYFAGLCLLDEFLEVHLWYQLTNMDRVDDFLDSVTGDDEYIDSEEEEDAESEDFKSVDNWRDSKRNVYLNYNSVYIPDVVKSEEEAKISATTFSTWKNEFFNGQDCPIEKLENLIKQKTPSSHWLRMIIYLLINEFSLESFEDYHSDVYNDQAMLTEAYAVYHSDDALFTILDNFNNEGIEPEPIITEIYTEKNSLRANPDKDLSRLFEMFSALFYYDFKTDDFYENDRYRIQTHFSNLDLQQWKTVLCRRSKCTNQRWHVLFEAIEH